MTGTLGLFSLVDLIQLLSGAGRTGRLLIEHPRGDAKIYFEEGEIVHARFDDHVGEDAVYALFADERGPFEFTAGLPALEKTVELGTQNLVLEAVRRLDESRRDDDDMAAYESDVVPERTDDARATRVTLGDEEHALLARVDGQRSLQRIADQCTIPIAEASRILARLVAADVVAVRKRRPRTARLVVDVATFQIPHGTAAVDSTIVRAWEASLGHRPDRVACRRENGRVVTFDLLEREGAGAYLLLGRFTLLRSGLRSDDPLLVRPHEDAE